MKDPKTFKKALKSRDLNYEIYKYLNAKCLELKKEIMDADDWCNHYRKFDDKWERVFNVTFHTGTD